MSNAVELNDTPLFIRFLDRFLQEKNIKWMLALGGLILICSSFMLVNRYWDNSFFSAPLKGLVILCYTLLIDKAGWWAQNRLGLRKTGTALLALTVVLIPLVFFSIQWVVLSNTASSHQSVGAYIGLLIAATAFTSRAATRIFRHFLHKTPPTFLLSYLSLSASGALLPLVPQTPGASMLIAGLLWAIFFIGTIKISRHTFWLVESRCYPRIFGFFPIALLGILFLSQFCFRLGEWIEWEWIGLGIVLTAVPILLTADSIAQVFQQRTGNLIRPIPWSIIAPIVLGIILCVLGVGLTFSGLRPSHSPLAITPASAIAAIVFTLVARRTGRPGFVWGLLILIAISYQFMPFFFKQLALQVVQSSASAVQEEKLPYAFYGLTYLPLILIMTVVAIRLEAIGNRLFVTPLRYFSSGLAFLLLVVSLSHPKAMFPVAALMTIVFAIQTRAYRLPILLRAGIASWLLGAFGWIFFADSVLGIEASISMAMVTMALALAALLWPGLKLDRAVARFDGKARQDCAITSLIGSLLLPAFWLSGSAYNPSIILVATPVLLMLVQSLYWSHTWVSIFALGFFYSGAAWLAPGFGFADDEILIAGLASLLIQWSIGYWFARHPRILIARAFGSANLVFSKTLLSIAATLVITPLACFVILNSRPWQAEWLLTSLAIVIWTFDVARRDYSTRFLYLGVTLTFLMAATALDPSALEWTGLLWVFIMIGSAGFLKWINRFSNNQTLGFFQDRLDRLFIQLLKLGTFPTLFVFDPAILAAGGLATVSLLTWYKTHPKVDSTKGWIVANWQVIALIIAFTGPAYRNLLDAFHEPNQAMLLCLALVSALSLCYWQVHAYYRGRYEDSAMHRLALRFIGLISLLVALQSPPSDWIDAAAVFVTIIIWIASELHAAYFHQEQSRVWTAQAMLFVLGFYCHRYIDLGGHTGLIVLFIVAIGQSALGARLKNILSFSASSGPATIEGLGQVDEHIIIQSRSVFSGPFTVVGSLLMVLVVIAGLFKPVAALNTLTLFGVAGFYFYQSRKFNRPAFAWLAGIIANIVIFRWAFALFWTDPQFFMIPAGATVLALTRHLRKEIEPTWHNPLYYIGALMILVSPVFAILDQESWLPMFSLLIASVLVVLGSIGLRVKALIYTGSAFLGADLLAMVIRSTMNNPHLLPLIGVALGILVLGLAAWSERHRENLLQRMRILSAHLQQWA